MEDKEEAKPEKSGETAANLDEKDGDDRQLVVDKHFVLPKRSTRSSRIIKPNKRLLDMGGISSKKSTSDVVSKPKPKNYFGLTDFASDMVASTSSASSSASTSSVALSQKLLKETFPSFGTAKLNSSFVMRQPRLQFQTDKGGSFVGATASPSPALSSAISLANALSFGSLNNANSGMGIA